MKISFYFLLFNQTQGRRKLFYSEGDWVKISPTMVGWRWKIEKKYWLKRLKVVLQKYKNIEMMDQYRNNSKFYIYYSFFENIISGIQIFCVLSTRSSGHHQSFFYSRFSIRKSQSQRKLVKKITHFSIQLHSKNLTYFMNLNSLDIEKNMLPKHIQKPVSLYKFFSKHVSV